MSIFAKKKLHPPCFFLVQILKSETGKMRKVTGVTLRVSP